MRQPIDTAARGLAAVALLAALVLASPLQAAISQPDAAAQLAQATPPAPPPGAAPAPPPGATPAKHRSRTDRVEQRIKTLHHELGITAAQETQWNAVAQVMRDNAAAIQQAVQQREQNPGMTAVDDLKAYEAIVDAHAQGTQKLVAAFETLYASLSDEQKKKADILFSHAHHNRSRGKT